MKSYLREKALNTTINVNVSVVGERLEERVHRMLYNQEPIGDGAPLIYTDRRKGVLAEHDIRTDRFEIALDAIDNVHKKNLERRADFYKELEKKNEPSANANGSTDAT